MLIRTAMDDDSGMVLLDILPLFYHEVLVYLVSAESLGEEDYAAQGRSCIKFMYLRII